MAQNTLLEDVECLLIATSLIFLHFLEHQRFIFKLIYKTNVKIFILSSIPCVILSKRVFFSLYRTISCYCLNYSNETTFLKECDKLKLAKNSNNNKTKQTKKQTNQTPHCQQLEMKPIEMEDTAVLRSLRNKSVCKDS